MDRSRDSAQTLLHEDHWAHMILHAATRGPLDFEQLHTRLGLARTALANRLNRLVDARILSRRTAHGDARKIRYHLTDQGRALLPLHDAIHLPAPRGSIASTRCTTKSFGTVERPSPSPAFTKGTPDR